MKESPCKHARLSRLAERQGRGLSRCHMLHPRLAQPQGQLRNSEDETHGLADEPALEAALRSQGQRPPPLPATAGKQPAIGQ